MDENNIVLYLEKTYREKIESGIISEIILDEKLYKAYKDSLRIFEINAAGVGIMLNVDYNNLTFLGCKIKEKIKSTEKIIHPPFIFTGSDGYKYEWNDIQNKMIKID